jgi:hypothetical protein
MPAAADQARQRPDPGQAPDARHSLRRDPRHWIPVGLDEDLDEAMKKAVGGSDRLSPRQFGMPQRRALAYLSAATNFAVGEVVDKVKQDPRAHREGPLHARTEERPRSVTRGRVSPG